MAVKSYTADDLAYFYVLGVQHERERAACAEHEAQLFWGRTAEQVHRDRYAELMGLFAQRAEALGRKLYFGGPVVW